MNVSEWMPVLVALIALLGGGLTYWYQRLLDRRVEFEREKREAYREFLTQLRVYERKAARAAHSEEADSKRVALEQYLAALSKLMMIASQEVYEEIKNFNDMVRNLSDSYRDKDESLKTSKEEFDQALENLIICMRKDFDSGQLRL